MTNFELVDQPTDWFEVLGPPVERDPIPEERPHVLIYEGDEEFTVEHYPECDTEFDEEPRCGVQFELDNSGLGSFFSDDPDDADNWYGPTIVRIPGRYWIEFWSETWNHHEYGPQYEAGIQPMYPEEFE